MIFTAKWNTVSPCSARTRQFFFWNLSCNPSSKFLVDSKQSISVFRLNLLTATIQRVKILKLMWSGVVWQTQSHLNRLKSHVYVLQIEDSASRVLHSLTCMEELSIGPLKLSNVLWRDLESSDVTPLDWDCEL